MKTYQQMKKAVILVTSIGVLATLAACGGSDESAQQNDCLDNIIILFICAAASTDNTSIEQAPIPAGVTSGVGKSVVPVTAALVDEYEPNNVLDNANIVTLPGGSNNVAQGVEFSGSVQSGNDNADHFVFTPNRSGAYRVFLCAETCNDSLQDDATYIMIYDQNQTTIASTPVGTVAQQEIIADLTAGMAYYVEVNGYNSGNAIYDYRLALSN